MSKASPPSIAFALSDDSAIESVLTDIPFFCVGLMAFGILTFVLITKRINLVAIYLYISSFIAFIAAILDLSQTLAQGRTTLSTVTTSGLTIAREVGLALSVGFLYVFLWCLVAQCPRGEEPTSYTDIKAKYNSRDHAHSASWERWGILGLLLKWSLLGLSFSIPILQIIWRVSAPDPQFGTIYITDATIEVVVSALFILKLFLNTFLSPLTPWWRPVRSNAAPTIALLIGGGLGIGNLASLAFSECTLGRFLRAMEIYILILFVLIIAFYNPPASHTVLDLPIVKELRSDAAWEKPRNSTFVMNPPTAQPPVIIDRPASTNEGGLVAYSHSSTKSRLPSWILPHSSRRKEHLYNRDSELGMASDHDESARGDPKSSSTQRGNENADVMSVVVDASKLDGERASTKERPFTAVSISSYYGMTRDSNAPFPMPPPTFTRGMDSPVYGLNGIINQTRATDTSPSRPNSNAGSFDELLRQQTELDKSIAALRLFSSSGPSMLVPSETQTPVPEVSPAELEISPSKDRLNSTSTLSYLGRKPDSASNRSEFSLSIFPEPPAVDASSLAPANERDRFTRRSRVPRIDAATNHLLSIEIPDQESSSLPVSPSHSEKNGRFNSAGTQYDVTSFIGGLTIPTSGAAFPSSNMTNRTILSDVESEDESTPTAAPPAALSPNTTGLRQITLGSSIPIMKPPETLESTTASTSSVTTESLETTPRLKQEPNIILRPLLLGTSSAAVPLTLSSNTKVPIGPRRKNGGLPSNPRRPAISGPSFPLQDGMGDHAPGAFERPRPPPLWFVPDKSTL